MEFMILKCIWNYCRAHFRMERFPFCDGYAFTVPWAGIIFIYLWSNLLLRLRGNHVPSNFHSLALNHLHGSFGAVPKCILDHSIQNLLINLAIFVNLLNSGHLPQLLQVLSSPLVDTLSWGSLYEMLSRLGNLCWGMVSNLKHTIHRELIWILSGDIFFQLVYWALTIPQLFLLQAFGTAA